MAASARSHTGERARETRRRRKVRSGGRRSAQTGPAEGQTFRLAAAERPAARAQRRPTPPAQRPARGPPPAACTARLRPPPAADHRSPGLVRRRSGTPRERSRLSRRRPLPSPSASHSTALRPPSASTPPPSADSSSRLRRRPYDIRSRIRPCTGNRRARPKTPTAPEPPRRTASPRTPPGRPTRSATVEDGSLAGQYPGPPAPDNPDGRRSPATGTIWRSPARPPRRKLPA